VKKIYFTIPGVLLLLLMLFGCSTGSNATKKDYTALAHESVQLEIRYINRNELYREFGNKNNPYARHLNGPAITFEVVGRTGDDVIYTVDMFEVVLESEQGRKQPVSKKWMASYWHETLRYGKNPRNKKSTVYSNWSESVTTDKIEKDVLPEVWEIMPGEEIRGLILFDPLRNVKTPVTLRIPLYEPSGTVVHTFEYQVNL
jgi:hypothetical protein